MTKKIIRLDESKLKAIIMESVKRVLRETREDVCNKLIALQNRFGDIQQINLPDGVNLSSIESEDIKIRLRMNDLKEFHTDTKENRDKLEAQCRKEYIEWKEAVRKQMETCSRKIHT